MNDSARRHRGDVHVLDSATEQVGRRVAVPEHETAEAGLDRLCPVTNVVPGDLHPRVFRLALLHDRLHRGHDGRCDESCCSPTGRSPADPATGSHAPPGGSPKVLNPRCLPLRHEERQQTPANKLRPPWRCRPRPRCWPPGGAVVRFASSPRCGPAARARAALRKTGPWPVAGGGQLAVVAATGLTGSIPSDS